MRDPISQNIRNYYDSIVERTDPTQDPDVPAIAPRRSNLWAAAAVAAMVVVAIGIVPFLGSGSPADNPAANPSVSDAAPIATLAPSVRVSPPTRILLADGTEIGRILGGRSSAADGYEALFDYVVSQMIDGHTEIGITAAERAENLGLNGEGGGLEIQLSLDGEIQAIVESVIDEWPTDPSTVVTVVVVDNETGLVVATAPTGSVGGDAFLPAVELASGTLAHVYTAVAGLETGMRLDSVWQSTSPTIFESADWPTDWTVYNAGGGGSGSITLSDALARSVDSVFAAVAIDVGADAVIDAAGRLGVSIADTSAAVPPEAVGIGAGNVSAMDVAAMFTTLSRDGYQTQPTLIDSIADADGQILYQAAPGEIRTVAPEVIELLRDPLAEVQITGTAPRARSRCRSNWQDRLGRRFHSRLVRRFHRRVHGGGGGISD